MIWQFNFIVIGVFGYTNIGKTLIEATDVVAVVSIAILRKHYWSRFIAPKPFMLILKIINFDNFTAEFRNNSNPQ